MSRTYFFWDPLSDNILQERDETGTVTAEYTTESGLYGNLISQNRGGVESQYHFDPQGSTLALTDDGQQVTDTYSYSAFGEVTEHTGSSVNPFQYVGQKGYYRDAETGEYHVRRRQYFDVIERWLSPDPLLFIDGSNLYAYVNNNPLISIDPSGLLRVTTTVVTIPFIGLNLPLQGIYRCGAVFWLTTWALDPGETDGLILQQVDFFEDVTNCKNPGRNPPCKSSPFSSCVNKAKCVSGSYIEAWRVKGGRIFSKLSEGESSTDAFIYFGCDDPCNPNELTRGTYTQAGRAFFIPDKIWLPKKDIFKKAFNRGPLGVRNACSLLSGCDPGPASVLFHDWFLLKTTSWTYKRVLRKWDCCNCCEDGYVHYMYHAFAPSGEVIE